MVDDFDKDNIDKRTFDNQITPTKKNREDYMYLVMGTKAYYTYLLTGENLKPQIALANVVDNKEAADIQLKQWKDSLKNNINKADVTKDKKGNTVYSYTTIEQVVYENDDSSVNDTNDLKSIITINKDGYIVNKKIIRITDNKVVKEFNFDMFIK